MTRIFASILLALTTTASAAVVTLIDGRVVPCASVSIAENTVNLKGTPQRNETTITTRELRVIDFKRTPQRSASRFAAVVYHNHGGRLRGTITAQSEDGIEVETTLGQHTFAFSTLAGIWFENISSNPAVRAEFDSTLSNRLPGKDVLITEHDGKSAAVRGRIAMLGPEGGTIQIGRLERPFQSKRIAGIVFATGAINQDAKPTLVELRDNSVLTGRLITLNENTLRLAASFGPELDIAVDRIARLRFQSDLIVFLSDMVPVADESSGLLHPPAPARMDRSFSNRKLSMHDRVFAKGIGVRAHSLLRYRLEGRFKSFAATVGIDDAVRPRGSVLFKISGDGRELRTTEVLTGRDQPHDIVVEVTGVNELTLEVLPGPDADLSDHADWADARLILDHKETGP